MPTVEDYAPHAPFTLDELVVAANRILGNDPKLAIKDRTVRYYIAQRLLPPPSGGPKFARYGIEHLKRIVAIRNWLVAGFNLEEASDKLQRGEHGGEAEPVIRESMIMERQNARRSPKGPTQRTVRRIYLSRHTVLEVDEDADIGVELDVAIHELERLRRDLRM
jgi:DNA-binding transcriptional MerR regulator